MEKPFFSDYSMEPPVVSDEVRAKVEALASLIQPEQRSPEWYMMRDQMLTASDWGTILGENHYEKPKKILYKKCGLGEPFNGNAATRWGQKYEDVAVQIYERRNQTRVREFGLIPHPVHSFLGASPDGITADGVMVEIKCPTSRVITGEPPRYYWCQMQAQLEVCDLERCDFLECKLEEYESAEEYFEDGDHLLTESYGMEKGVILHRGKDGGRRPSTDGSPGDGEIKYEYVPLGTGREEIERLVAGADGVTYWRLQVVSCIHVYRDREWFAQALPKLEAFWQTILEHRTKGDLKIEPEPPFNPFAKRPSPGTARTRTEGGTASSKTRPSGTPREAPINPFARRPARTETKKKRSNKEAVEGAVEGAPFNPFARRPVKK